MSFYMYIKKIAQEIRLYNIILASAAAVVALYNIIIRKETLLSLASAVYSPRVDTAV